MHDGMPYGRIQGQGQGHEPIQGSRIENLQSREVDRQSPTGLIFFSMATVCCIFLAGRCLGDDCEPCDDAGGFEAEAEDVQRRLGVLQGTATTS